VSISRRDWIGIGIGVVATGGIAWYFYTKSAQGREQTNSTADQAASAANQAALQSAELIGLLTGGESEGGNATVSNTQSVRPSRPTAARESSGSVTVTLGKPPAYAQNNQTVNLNAGEYLKASNANIGAYNIPSNAQSAAQADFSIIQGDNSLASNTGNTIAEGSSQGQNNVPCSPFLLPLEFVSNNCPNL
jgi:hypothetical protein